MAEVAIVLKVFCLATLLVWQMANHLLVVFVFCSKCFCNLLLYVLWCKEFTNIKKIGPGHLHISRVLSLSLIKVVNYLRIAEDIYNFVIWNKSEKYSYDKTVVIFCFLYRALGHLFHIFLDKLGELIASTSSLFIILGDF